MITIAQQKIIARLDFVFSFLLYIFILWIVTFCLLTPG